MEKDIDEFQAEEFEHVPENSQEPDTRAQVMNWLRETPRTVKGAVAALALFGSGFGVSKMVSSSPEDSGSVAAHQEEANAFPESNREVEPEEEQLRPHENIPEELLEHSEEASVFIRERILHGRTTDVVDYRNSFEAIRGAYVYETETPDGQRLVIRMENPVTVVVDDPSGETDGLLEWAAPVAQTGQIITINNGYAEMKDEPVGENENPLRYNGKWDVGAYYSFEDDGLTPQQATITPSRLENNALDGNDITAWVARGNAEGKSCNQMSIQTQAHLYVGETAYDNATRSLNRAHNPFEESELFQRDKSAAGRFSDIEGSHSC